MLAYVIVIFIRFHTQEVNTNQTVCVLCCVTLRASDTINNITGLCNTNGMYASENRLLRLASSFSASQDACLPPSLFLFFSFVQSHIPTSNSIWSLALQYNLSASFFPAAIQLHIRVFLGEEVGFLLACFGYRYCCCCFEYSSNFICVRVSG